MVVPLVGLSVVVVEDLGLLALPPPKEEATLTPNGDLVPVILLLSKSPSCKLAFTGA